MFLTTQVLFGSLRSGLRPLCAAAAVLAAVWAIQVPASNAQVYREIPGIDAAELTKKLLESAHRNDASRVEAALTLLNPLLDALQRKFETDFRSEILQAAKARDAAKTVSAIQRLMAADLRDRGDVILESLNRNPSEAENVAKGLASVYQSISQSVQQKDFASDSKIRNALRGLVLAFGSSSAYSADKSIASGENVNQSAVRDAVALVQHEITRLFPLGK